MIKHITIVGAGNVGQHLAHRLHACGHSLRQIFSRTPAKAARIAAVVGARGISRLQDLTPDADLYILAITDDALSEVTEKIAFLNAHQKIVVHTSGSVSSTVFKDHFDRYGIFYPLQTFSAAKPVDFNQLPFCIYGSQATIQTDLMALARSICPNVYAIDDAQRGILHVAAVLVNNFTNRLYAMAHHICQDHELPFELLLPLIRETVRKIADTPPDQVQTGPAMRGDQQTIDRHDRFLEQYPDYQALYRLFTVQLQAMATQRLAQ